MKPTEPYEYQIIEWSNQKPDEEICGLLIKHKGSFVAMQIANVAADRQQTFAMDEKPFLDAVNSGQAWGTWHVHPNPFDTDGPSPPDIDRANAWQLPGCVYVRQKMHFRYYMPDGLPSPLYGRPYVPGIWDCYALVRDGLKKYLDFDHVDLDREALDHKGCLPDHETFWGPQGWELLLQPKPGRIAMIDFGGHGKCNHLALIISRTELLHHVRGQLARLDFFGSWQRWTLGYLAHPRIENLVAEKHWIRLPLDPNEFSPHIPGANGHGKAPDSLVDAFGRPTRVKIPDNPPRRLVRHPLRDIRPQRPKL